MDLVKRTLEAQIAEGRATIEREGVAVDAIEVLHEADMQFQGQSHILTVGLPGAEVTREALHQAFADAYWRRFEVALPEIRPVLVNLHTAVIGRRPDHGLDALLPAEGRAASVEEALVERRRVWFAAGDGQGGGGQGGGWRETPVYRREKLPAGASFAGPAIVEQLDCTIVIEPGDRVTADKLGNLVVTIGGQDA